MSRGTCLRVNSGGILLIFSAALFSLNLVDVGAYSCHEVKTAFQLRQIGPVQWVPEVPGTDANLMLCKHQGLSCCTRKMEEHYKLAAGRDVLQNIHSYSFELSYLLSGHRTAFQDTFQYLLSFSQGHLSSLLEGSYPSVSRQALPHVNQLFSSLSQYLRGHNTSVETVAHQFFDQLFPLVYTRLVRPGAETGGWGAAATERSECLRMTRQDVSPFGPHPTSMAQELTEALGAGRQLGLAMSVGSEVVNATEHVAISRECSRGLARMTYCPHCRGLTLIKPCLGYCLNMLRGCLASLVQLDQPWRDYASLLDRLTHAVASHHSLELALLGVRGHVNQALQYAQLHGPLITATVDKVCGLSTGESASLRPTSPEVTTFTMTSSNLPPSAPPALGQLAHLRRTHAPPGTPSPIMSSSFPLKPSKSNKQNSLRKIAREFLTYLKRYKSFFVVLPEMLCEAQSATEDSTCWNGDDVVERYIGRVVGNGLHAQQLNPEVKVRRNPTLDKVKERLEQFNQETLESFPSLGQRELWDDLGSGETEDGSATDCDDEDGCQASGDGKDSLEPEVPTDVKPLGKQPGGKGPQEDPQMTPVVRTDPVGSGLALRWSFVLILAALASQRTLF